ncbi:MAG TPA: hypothetical protein VM282_01505 [Acidimicrobiales bacterium]|nr:hypothetical protein [Acidimicrobiales bacterium]
MDVAATGRGRRLVDRLENAPIRVDVVARSRRSARTVARRIRDRQVVTEQDAHLDDAEQEREEDTTLRGGLCLPTPERID